MKVITGENEMKPWTVGRIGFARHIYLRKGKNVFPVMADAIYNTNGLGSYASIPV